MKLKKNIWTTLYNSPKATTPLLSLYRWWSWVKIQPSFVNAHAWGRSGMLQESPPVTSCQQEVSAQRMWWSRKLLITHARTVSSYLYAVTFAKQATKKTRWTRAFLVTLQLVNIVRRCKKTEKCEQVAAEDLECSIWFYLGKVNVQPNIYLRNTSKVKFCLYRRGCVEYTFLL